MLRPAKILIGLLLAMALVGAGSAQAIAAPATTAAVEESQAVPAEAVPPAACADQADAQANPDVAPADLLGDLLGAVLKLVGDLLNAIGGILKGVCVPAP